MHGASLYFPTQWKNSDRESHEEDENQCTKDGYRTVTHLDPQFSNAFQPVDDALSRYLFPNPHLEIISLTQTDEVFYFPCG